MIWRPRVGQRVRLHYRRGAAPLMPCHGLAGRVVCAGRGPGPRNALVRLDNGSRAVVPRGNLVAEAALPLFERPEEVERRSHDLDR